jgi:hypothetical protein
MYLCHYIFQAPDPDRPGYGFQHEGHVHGMWLTDASTWRRSNKLHKLLNRNGERRILLSSSIVGLCLPDAETLTCSTLSGHETLIELYLLHFVRSTHPPPHPWAAIWDIMAAIWAAIWDIMDAKDDLTFSFFFFTLSYNPKQPKRFCGWCFWTLPL